MRKHSDLHMRDKRELASIIPPRIKLDEFISVKEVAAKLNISRQGVLWHIVNNRYIAPDQDYVKEGKKYFIRRGSLAKFSRNYKQPFSQRSSDRINKARHAYNRAGIVYVYAFINGKSHRRSTGMEANKANLAYAEREWKNLLGKSAKTQIKTKTTIECFGRESLKANEKDRKSITNADYSRLFAAEIIPVFGKREIASITPFELYSWLNSLVSKTGSGRAKSKQLRKLLNTIFRDAVLDRIIDHNPMKDVKAIQASPRDIRPFTLDETRIILSNANGTFKNYLTTAFFTGARLGELLALRWENINFNNASITIAATRTRGKMGSPKTKSSYRTIDMLPLVERALIRQRSETGDGEFVFSSKGGGGYKTSNFLRDPWRRVLLKSGLDYREIRSTRYTFATIMIEKKESILWTSKMLGHKNSAVTLEKYAAYAPELKVKRAIFLHDFEE